MSLITSADKDLNGTLVENGQELVLKMAQGRKTACLSHNLIRVVSQPMSAHVSIQGFREVSGSV